MKIPEDIKYWIKVNYGHWFVSIFDVVMVGILAAASIVIFILMVMEQMSM